MLSRVTLNYRSSCYHLPSPGMAVICHHARLKKLITLYLHSNWLQLLWVLKHAAVALWIILLLLIKIHIFYSHFGIQLCHGTSAYVYSIKKFKSFKFLHVYPHPSTHMYTSISIDYSDASSVSSLWLAVWGNQ